ncbi:MAG: glycine--tRNA ligase [Nanoarchaeota archaeon]|nr:glycine--tRNA ligase [Nanoarchaeota archaeon]MBU1103337.1 glycine--tRNA ligase [Nanoarchaeota archaeon]
MSKAELSIDELAAFCKRRGFTYQSAEIYGSFSGFWDFGHLGVELKNNIKKEWWKFHVHNREDIAGIDGSIITNPKVWEASGHISHFVDIAVVNKKTGKKEKIDSHELEKYKKDSEYEIHGEFNPLFTTQVGPIKNESVLAYLRPETAQLIFTNFKFVQDNARLKLPFGIAQIGKAFRNEISPREFLFRSREFEQMEIEYFTAPKQKCPYIDEIKGVEIEILTEEMQTENKKGKLMKIYGAWKKGLIKNDWHAYFMALELSWFLLLGANPKKFRARQHASKERSHYATDTWDIEYKFPMGWRELQGFANRSDFDLKQHEKFSKKSLAIQDEKFGKVLPNVVCEPSLGVERTFLVFLLDAYEDDKKRGNIILHLSPKLAPYKAAVFPLISKGQILEVSKEVYHDLLEEFNILFDKSGSIGRRYARNDEIGTPFCITIDNQTLEDKTVTIRDRDTTEQVRTKTAELKDTLRKLINNEISLDEAGKAVK